MSGAGALSEEERFWSRVNRSGPVVRDDLGRCWTWLGGKTTGGYGRVQIAGRSDLAHRAAFRFAHSDPGEACVLHACDNPSCVCPDHLTLGTKGDNNRDRAAKGRSSTGDRHYSRQQPARLARGSTHFSVTKPEAVCRGSMHGCAKVDEACVQRIRQRSVAGELQKAIARDVGLSNTAVGDIVRRKTWRHVP